MSDLLLLAQAAPVLEQNYAILLILGMAFGFYMASRIGLPVSTTHTLVGAVLGVGLARSIGALNLRVVFDIIVSWVVTLPAAAFLAIVFYNILKWIFG